MVDQFYIYYLGVKFLSTNVKNNKKSNLLSYKRLPIYGLREEGILRNLTQSYTILHKLEK